MEQFAKIFHMDTSAIARRTTLENTANVSVNELPLSDGQCITISAGTKVVLVIETHYIVKFSTNNSPHV